MEKAVVVLFNSVEPAYQAVQALRDAGFPREHISMVMNDPSGQYSRYLPADPQATPEPITGKAAAAGAGTGAVMGGLTGLLVGLGALVLPGIGPVIAAGPLAAALSSLVGAGVGAASGGILGGVVGLLVDLGLSQEQSEQYAEGVRRGGVLVVFEGGPGETERAREIIEQFHPVDMDRQSMIWKAGGWGSFEVEPEPKEAKPLGATAEASQDPADVRGFSDEDEQRLEKVFRNYYHNSRNSLKYKYEECRPAYVYGHLLNTDPRFWKLSWEEIEPLVREEWEKKDQPGSWEEFRESVRYMWEGNFED